MIAIAKQPPSASTALSQAVTRAAETLDVSKSLLVKICSTSTNSGFADEAIAFVASMLVFLRISLKAYFLNIQRRLWARKRVLRNDSFLDAY